MVDTDEARYLLQIPMQDYSDHILLAYNYARISVDANETSENIAN